MLNRSTISFMLLVCVLAVNGVFLSWSVVWGQVNDSGNDLSSSVADCVEKVSPYVVTLELVGGEEALDKVAISDVTTGLMVSPDGWLVTSLLGFDPAPASVLAIDSEGKVRLAKLVARDYIHKIALLKTEPMSETVVSGTGTGTTGTGTTGSSESTGKPSVELFTSFPFSVAPANEVKVGQWAVACGRIYGQTRNRSVVNVSVGIISARNRVWGKAFQTDAAVSPNNYGGPLVDLQGRVIGLLVPMSPVSDDLTAGVDWYDSGIGFAVPFSTIQTLLSQLVSGKDIEPGYTGVSPELSNPAIAEPVIGKIAKDSAAEKAGLLKGDRILTVDGLAIKTFAGFKRIVANKRIGDSIHLTVERLPVSKTPKAEDKTEDKAEDKAEDKPAPKVDVKPVVVEITVVLGKRPEQTMEPTTDPLQRFKKP